MFFAFIFLEIADGIVESISFTWVVFSYECAVDISPFVFVIACAASDECVLTFHA